MIQLTWQLWGAAWPASVHPEVGSMIHIQEAAFLRCQRNFANSLLKVSKSAFTFTLHFSHSIYTMLNGCLNAVSQSKIGILVHPQS